MAGDRLHDLFTVFTFKTPPSGDFVYRRKQKLERTRRARCGAPGGHPHPFMVLDSHAELGPRASLGERLPSDKLRATPQKNLRADCCKSRLRFATARAN